MTDQIKETIQKTILQILEDSTSQSNIQRVTRTHVEKVHFIPIRYRIIGGVLQGLNIKFGNFIEQLMLNIVEIDESVEVMSDSGKKVRLFFTSETDAAIDAYITSRQLPGSPDDCTPIFDALLEKVIQIEKTADDQSRQGIVKDVDGLFRTKDGLIVYTELKYNDDHDTGKFADINRKFIKTWAGLAVKLGITKVEELFPVIYYFNRKKRYGPIHTPSRNIMRGEQLFDKFLQIKYTDVDKYLTEVGDDPEILKIFDTMYEEIRYGELPKTDARGT